MIKRNISAYTNGTSALAMPRFVERPDEATIIAFPGSRSRAQEHLTLASASSQNRKDRAKIAAKRVLDSSEMYCSLKRESFMGCPYNAFTNKGIAALSTGAAVIGIVSLIFGA